VSADFFVAGLSITEDPFVADVGLLSVGLFRSELLVEGLCLLEVEPVDSDPGVGGIDEGDMNALELRLLILLLLGNYFTLGGGRLLFLTTNGYFWFRVFSLNFLEALVFSDVCCDSAACEEA